MIFVNRIAQIVHSISHSFDGTPNKNIGDAFLLVWKLNNFNVELDNDNLNQDEIDFIINNETRNKIDASIYSIVYIIFQINKSYELSKYRTNQGLNERIPNYKVRIGFGLHLGWSIEGAIGSEYKIDASYLSPNVNVSSMLESATKNYGVLILISGDLM